MTEPACRLAPEFSAAMTPAPPPAPPPADAPPTKQEPHEQAEQGGLGDGERHRREAAEREGCEPDADMGSEDSGQWKDSAEWCSQRRRRTARRTGGAAAEGAAAPTPRQQAVAGRLQRKSRRRRGILGKGRRYLKSMRADLVSLVARSPAAVQKVAAMAVRATAGVADEVKALKQARIADCGAVQRAWRGASWNDLVVLELREPGRPEHYQWWERRPH